MVLYVVTLPNPPAGQDFRFTVPGRYLYDVTGITAELATTGGPDLPSDYSGNGNDGTYVTAGGGPHFASGGAFSGDDCLMSSDSPTDSFSAGWYAPAAAMPVDAGSFTLGFWRKQTEPGTGAGVEWRTGGGSLCAQAFNGNSSLLEWNSQGGTGGWATAGMTWPVDGAWHFVAYVYDAGTQEMVIYLDGAAMPLDSDVPGTAFGATPAQVRWDYDGVNPSGLGLTDEIFFAPAALSGGQIAALYGTAPNFAAWTAAVLAHTPTVGYHLDGIGPGGGGRQPSLIVTDGTTELEAIPTGFAAVSTPGPYQYAWQPALNADTQSSDGTLTTVAIPQLLLPAGYTVGTRTLDLQSTDQWSNISLWWDDAYQLSSDAVTPYVYPPGARLVYQRNGA